jgi:hypothetical protein
MQRCSFFLFLATVFLSGACASSSEISNPDVDGGGSDVTAPTTDSGGGDSAPLPVAEAGTTPEGGAEAGAPDATPPDAALDAGSGLDANSVDAAWSGRPPAVPLIVRSPYVSTWSQADDPSTVWPTFWTGSVTGLTGMARIDGATFVFLGQPTGLTTSTTPMGFVSRIMTPTKTEYVFASGGITLTVDFLSPVELESLERQSAPLGYIWASAVASDGASHTVSLYFDISGEWANGDDSQQVTWARESVPHTGGNLTVQSIASATQQPLVEANQYPSWGTAFLAADATSGLTVEIGQDLVVRSLAASAGALDQSIDSNMPRAINNDWPVLGYNFALGTVSSTPSAPVTLLIGNARDPAVSYKGTSISPLWKAYWPTWEAMVADEFDDAANAIGRAIALDARVVSDALTAGGPDYAALCTLGLRQAFGGTELVGTADAPWMMLKEISSDGNVSTVDVVYPASPAFLYTNPLYLKLLLDPLLTYAESGDWPETFAEHDLGAAYPVAGGHDDGGGENMPIEETANMLIMMAAYTQRAAPADAKTYANLHYAIAKQWANYLLPNTLDPGCQNQTDDFTGSICHSVNLALKGIVGVGAMSVLAGAAGNTADQTSYLSQAQSLISQWATKAQDSGGQHLLLEYDIEGQWSLKYNALYDRILGLNLIPSSIITEESSWYTSQGQPFGVVLDPRNSYTKTDWSLWIAGAIDDPATRQTLIGGVYDYATTSTARVPFGDWYCVVNGSNSSDNSTCVAGEWKGFQARPVQGGMFSLLARQGTSIVSP